MDTTGRSERAVNRTKRWRRQYVINPAVQWKLAAWLVAAVFAVCSVMGILLFGVLERHVRWRVLNPGASYIGEVISDIVVFALVFSTIAAAGLGLWSIIITHRFCGPLSVIGRWLTELRDGRWPTRRPLRKRDEFKDLYALFWQAVDSLKVRKRAELTTLTELLEALKSAADADHEARKSALDSVATRVQAIRKEVANALGDELHDTPGAPMTSRGSASTPASACAELAA